MAIELRLLNAADAQDYKRVRLNALKLSPTAFSSSWETAKDLPDSFFEGRAAARPDNFIFGAFVDGALVATAGGYVETKLKRDHVAHVVGMWVEPGHRGQGLARKLLAAVIEQLQTLSQVTSIQLAVTAGNAHAVSLYEDFGFRPWGKEPNAIRVDGAYHDDLHMVLVHG